jgi:signal transduction histidine kinase
MKLVYGLVLMAWLAFQQIMEPKIDMTGIASLLGMLCLFIVKERFLNKTWSSVLFLGILLVLSLFQAEFLLLLAIPVVDFLYSKQYVYGEAAGILSLILSLVEGYYLNSLIFALSALFGYIYGEKEWNERQHAIVLDDERRVRYRLEATRNELVQSRKEIEHLTRVKERNRIAHDIHDNVGHSIAGVLFQIEAAKRVVSKDTAKLGEILNLCSSKLSEALQLTRKTVYNINTDRKIGPERLM